MSEKKTQSITRALTKLKNLDRKIATAIAQEMITYKKGDNLVSAINHSANLQSATDLIEQRQKIKVLIRKVNAVTNVTILGKSMTIDEAIEKKHNMKYLHELLQSMRAQYSNVTRVVDNHNQILEEQIHETIMSAAGSSQKMTDTSLKTIRDQIMGSNKAEIVDLADLESNIKELSKDIEEFEVEVDLALSEVNAITMITID